MLAAGAAGGRGPPLEAFLRPLDAVRRAALCALGPRVRSWVLPRERRVAILGCVSIALALAGALCAPLVLLALGPLVLGVPHLVADVRYLVARPGLHRRRAAIAGAAVAVLGLVAGLGVRAGLLGGAAAVLASRASWARRAAGVAVCAGLLALAQTSPFRADVVFLHAHNLVAIAFWLAWRRRAGRLHWAPLAAFGLGTWILLAAPLPPWLAGAEGARWAGISIAELGQTLSLSPDATVTLRLVLFFAFAQSVHYAAWLRLVPEEDRRRAAPRSYAQSLRALRADVGRPVLWIALAAAAVLAGLALVSVRLARDAYLGLAYAHGHLELVAAALLGVEGSRRLASPGPAGAAAAADRLGSASAGAAGTARAAA